jgi:iron-sulfur cluster repair protein YtfE (RIC family)
MSELRNLQKELKKTDPLMRNVEKGLEAVENSPMDPPDAYDDQAIVNAEVELPYIIQQFKNEHWNATERINSFEKVLATFKENRYDFTEEIGNEFSSFFKFFDDELIKHHMKEEKILFPLLHERLLSNGEHSKEPMPKTAIDLMEDDHNKSLQLGALAFNLFGLATRLKDMQSRMFVFDTAYNNARELIELLKLHIFREDNTLFPLAANLITEDEFFRMKQRFNSFS